MKKCSNCGSTNITKIPIPEGKNNLAILAFADNQEGSPSNNAHVCQFNIVPYQCNDCGKLEFYSKPLHALEKRKPSQI